MTIEQMDVVDFIGWDPKTEEVSLLICDHLEWTEEDQSNKFHMFLLQEKLNAYLAFIESGDIYQSYPKARGKEIIIKIVAEYPMSREAEAFFEKSRAFLLKAGHQIRFMQLP